jgi:KipI family sensor histidine kinase inhibitor
MLSDESLCAACAAPAAHGSVGAGKQKTPGSNRTGGSNGGLKPKQRSKKPLPEKVLKSFNTWAFKREQPSDQSLLHALISGAIEREESISFVLYWGKGPRSYLAEPDVTCLDFLALLAHRVREVYDQGAAITLIFTDTHDSIWLGGLTRQAETLGLPSAPTGSTSQDLLQRLMASARKWYRGTGTPEEGALKYYEMNMVEKRAVEIAYPRSIFITFSGSELRDLFPQASADLPYVLAAARHRRQAVVPPTAAGTDRHATLRLALSPQRQFWSWRMDGYRLLSAGDTALVVEFGDRIDQRLNAQVLALARHLNEANFDGLIETVPTFRSLMIHFEPLVLPAATLAAHVAELVKKPLPAGDRARFWALPICYDPDFALDLNDAATRLNLSPAQVIERHNHVYMLGFLPGQAYMGDLAGDLVLPRRATPRAKIPAGSVAIAMSMTCIFPMETPCGWHLIGRSPVPLFELVPSPSPLLAPGDKVRFTPVSRREYEDVAAKIADGTFRPAPELSRAAA